MVKLLLLLLLLHTIILNNTKDDNDIHDSHNDGHDDGHDGGDDDVGDTDDCGLHVMLVLFVKLCRIHPFSLASYSYDADCVTG